VRYPLEVWSEVFAYHLAKVLGLPAPPCFPAFIQSPEYGFGSLSQSFVNEKQNQFLVHGGDIIMTIQVDFDRKSGKDHSDLLIQQCLRDLPDLFHGLFRQFVFDALIGNSDRHQDNWGILRSEAGTRLAPAFDNGSSLGRELSEQTVDDYLSDDIMLNAYINRGKPHVRWASEGNLQRITHEQFIENFVSRSDQTTLFREMALDMLRFTTFDVETVIDSVVSLSRSLESPHQLHISPNRSAFWLKLIAQRRDRLVQRLERL
jgi:hypothetical protein